MEHLFIWIPIRAWLEPVLLRPDPQIISRNLFIIGLCQNRFGEVEKASFQKELPTVLGTEGMCCYLERDSFWKVSI